MKKLLTWCLLMLMTSMSQAQDKQKVLDYLYSISGKQIIAGQHNKEPNAEPAKWTDYIQATTGKYPALWSGDFLFQQENIDNRWKMVKEAEQQWNNGALINLMWHGCPPDMGEPCGWDPGLLNAQLDDEQWQALITEGTDLNKRWKTRMDDIAVYLQYLEDKGVVVMFRPFHEMNQELFWWAGRKGPKGTAELYRQTHDYFEIEKGLTNLIWVWDMQDMSRDFQEYNPGEAYWDVFAFDIYDSGYEKTWYDYILPIVGDKPMAIGECMKIPSEKVLEEQPRWIFFMPWAELVKERNSEPEIRALYEHPRVLTRDEMPGW
ncbi:glycosyl hydrolase [Marinoscillum luteum]|jgi:mannan endo-1,4-beta-mannosidase|uniref:Glycosyl hydrolase n=1 Tax=Marinoscillum luteum TaxID=861051 RepID=A0ABW7NDK5_9BACT